MFLLLRRDATAPFTHYCVNYTKGLKIEQNLLPASHLHLKRTKAIQTPASKQWLPIYHLPLIRWAASFNKLKIYQTIVTAACTPAAYGLVNAGMLSPGSDMVLTAVGVSGIITLTVCSLVSQNLIGFIYINEQKDRAKLAYIDFWGLRQELEIDVNDIVPETEQKNPSKTDFYKNIFLYSDPKRKFKLLTRYGVILEPNKFVELVGE